MPSVSSQFHATREEIGRLAGEFVQSESINVAVLTDDFYSGLVTTVDGLLECVLNVPRSKRVSVALSCERLRLILDGRVEFLRANEGAALFDLGRMIDSGLEESFFSCESDDPKKFSLARRVFRGLRKMTKAGAVGVSLVTGARAHYRNHRYSVSAEEAQRNGILLLSLSGTVKFEPGADADK